MTNDPYRPARRRPLATGLLLAAVVALSGCTGTTSSNPSPAATTGADTATSAAEASTSTYSPSVVPSQVPTEEVITGGAGTPTPYTSAEHGFVVSFPGFPSTEHSNLDVQGVSVPYTFYSKDVDNGNKSYAVQVVEYPASDFSLSGQERGSLDGCINDAAQIDGLTLVTSSNKGTFLGYPSASATYRYSKDGESYDVYLHLFIKGNSMYVLMTRGESKSTFDTFVNSFSFK